MGVFIEILIFSAISFYLCFRLWTLLGTRTGEEKRHEDEFEDNVVPFSKKKDEHIDGLKNSTEVIEGEVAKISKDAEKNLKKLKKIWPYFKYNAFLKKSERAYVSIIDAFTIGDKEFLKPFLSENVFSQFMEVLDGRNSSGHTLERKIEDISNSSIEKINIDEENDLISIDVRFITEQILLTKNADGSIIDNPAKIPLKYDDTWTFQHGLDNDEGIWVLSKTMSNG